MAKFLTTGPSDAAVRFVCAHGAGGGMVSPFLDTVAKLLAERGIAVWRFEFAYMAARRDGGSRKPPPKAERLMDEYRAAVAELPPGGAVMIGGKSMGGRVASLVADDLFKEGRIAGLVCLGYPFHPPKAPEKLRTAHLEAIGLPDADRAGRARPVRHAHRGRGVCACRRRSGCIGSDDGDHDLGPRGASGFTRKGNLTAAADAIAAFAKGLV